MGDSVVEFSVRAYTKMIMHAAKYPHCSVNGLLLAPITDQIQKIGSSPSHQSSENPPRTIFTDCIPLFHQIQGLTPMLEVALTQIEAMAKGAGLIIAGYYHANELFKVIFMGLRNFIFVVTGCPYTDLGHVDTRPTLLQF